MITIESVFSNKNQLRAFEHLSIKKNGAGTDKMSLAEFKEYWNINGDRIISQIYDETYNPGLILEYDIINGTGKKRTVIRFNTIDRFITRLLSQKLNDFYNPQFLSGSHAYQDNKGILTATEHARDFIENGNEYVVEIDINHFFAEISLDRLWQLLENSINDSQVLVLLKEYLYCTISNDGEVRKVNKGILQGSSLSPVLSNLYLHAFDQFLESAGYNWIRYSDNINIYVDSEEKGEAIFEDVCNKLRNDFNLPINQTKSGVFDVYERRLLGYDFRKCGSHVIINKHIYQKQEYYRQWHPCRVQKINQEYHILNDGILNKKDFALLFEDESEKHHIPVEATEQINLYNEVVLTSSVLRTLSYEGIRLGIYDKYGDLLGYFTPEKYNQDSKTVLAQCMEYADMHKRLDTAMRIEAAAIHNIRANLRYYNKTDKNLSEEIEKLNEGIAALKECKCVNELLLIEARCRQVYYHSFNKILDKPDFEFTIRSKRPPKDSINALISFGNTLLYNRIQQLLWKTSLDSRIGIFHAANRRHHSLNLDFADLFKPLIVDRIIFSLINRGQLRKDSFERNDDGSVYLNENGKKLFIQSFDKKMISRLDVKGQQYSYAYLIEHEIRAYLKHLTEGTIYKPYKYY